MADTQAMEKLENTLRIDDVDAAGYAGVYLPGGHGTMWDFPENDALRKILEKIWKNKKILAAVCHGPAGFLNVKNEDGEFLVKNRRVNSFTDEEERKAGKDKIVPFLLETALKNRGAFFESAGPYQGIVVEDSRLITGQNPASASLVASAILRDLGISPYENQEIQAAE